MSTYQVMPPLTADEYATLRADIEHRGVLVPVVRDQHGNLLDGHHRSQIADELGITYRVDVIRVQDEHEARSTARAYNMARRHLTRAQKRELIADEIQADPDRSDREIGRLLGVDHKTVGSVRRELRGEFPQPGEERTFHPLADQLMPVDMGFTDDDLDGLADSIRRLGLHNPIVLHRDGSIIDGRLRYLACVRAGVRPTYTTFSGHDDEIPDFLVGVNMLRGHYTRDQLVAIKVQADELSQSAPPSVREWFHHVDEFHALARELLPQLRARLDALDGRTDPAALAEMRDLVAAGKSLQHTAAENALDLERFCGALLDGAES